MTIYTSLIVFLIIGGIGFLFLAVSLIIGDLFEVLDIDFDGGFDGDGGSGEIGLLDSRVVSVFLTAFGFIAAITLQMGLGIFLSAAVGLGSGVLFAGLVFAFGYFLHTQQANSSVTERDLIGRTAQVIVGIKPEGIGQISCRVGEERVEKLARLREGEEEIKVGETVFIEESAGDSFIVSSMKNTGYSLMSE
ncbi:MAG: hypothetical protein R2747_23785 [Pyrinomonadaceae bacterium]